MPIAFTKPPTAPHGPQGGEGYAGAVIPGKPGRGEIRDSDGYRTVYHRRLWHPSLARIGLLEFHAFFLPCLLSLLRGRYDVVLCCTFLDTWAAILARELTGTPCD